MPRHRERTADRVVRLRRGDLNGIGTRDGGARNCFRRGGWFGRVGCGLTRNQQENGAEQRGAGNHRKVLSMWRMDGHAPRIVVSVALLPTRGFSCES